MTASFKRIESLLYRRIHDAQTEVEKLVYKLILNKWNNGLISANVFLYLNDKRLDKLIDSVKNLGDPTPSKVWRKIKYKL